MGVEWSCLVTFAFAQKYHLLRACSCKRVKSCFAWNMKQKHRIQAETYKSFFVNRWGVKSSRCYLLFCVHIYFVSLCKNPSMSPKLFKLTKNRTVTVRVCIFSFFYFDSQLHHLSDSQLVMVSKLALINE